MPTSMKVFENNYVLIQFGCYNVNVWDKIIIKKVRSFEL